MNPRITGSGCMDDKACS